jgi:hypothetical protein
MKLLESTSQLAVKDAQLQNAGHIFHFRRLADFKVIKRQGATEDLLVKPPSLA